MPTTPAPLSDGPATRATSRRDAALLGFLPEHGATAATALRPLPGAPRG